MGPNAQPCERASGSSFVRGEQTTRFTLARPASASFPTSSPPCPAATSSAGPGKDLNGAWAVRTDRRTNMYHDFCTHARTAIQSRVSQEPRKACIDYCAPSRPSGDGLANQSREEQPSSSSAPPFSNNCFHNRTKSKPTRKIPTSQTSFHHVPKHLPPSINPD